MDSGRLGRQEFLEAPAHPSEDCQGILSVFAQEEQRRHGVNHGLQREDEINNFDHLEIQVGPEAKIHVVTSVPMKIFLKCYKLVLSQCKKTTRKISDGIVIYNN